MSRRSGANRGAQQAQAARTQTTDPATAEAAATAAAATEAGTVEAGTPSGGADLVIDGELTIHTAGDRKTELLALLERGDTLTVDLSAVTELDAAGLQLLLLTRREATQLGKTLEITAASNAVTEALAIVHLDARLERLTPTPEGADR
ncbi:lipid asymmetry maintenance protein MlaB [Kineosporia sp. A_224]|uniref:STAS domain-containing protein n=1 Tax=Kineosporia sp. A_224 TaxID=1962180 RepID=UPI0018EA12B0|nr:STAS domain-containing protein [Kineosporia sp. A_224]